jgi:NADP-dependent 3-hydroxy acid dehydrogenase YdfG
VSPGIVETEFLPRAFGNQDDVNKIYQRAPAIMQAQDMADIVLFTLSAPPNVQVHDVLVRPTGDPN